jgi:hypothetical protein
MIQKRGKNCPVCKRKLYFNQETGTWEHKPDQFLKKGMVVSPCRYQWKDSPFTEASEPEGIEPTAPEKVAIGTKENGTIARIDRKKGSILRILQDFPEGLREETLRELTKVPRRTLYRHLKALEGEQLVTSIRPFWRLCQNQSNPLKMAQLLSSSEKIQGHKISFVLDLIDKPEWWETRENRLMRMPEIDFKQNIKWGNVHYQGVVKSNFLVQFFPGSIVFIPIKKYWGADAYDCFIQAIEQAIQTLDFIEERFKFKFFKEGVPHFRVRSHHYVKIQDAVAERCKAEGKGFFVEIEGKARVWVDFSKPFGIEAGNKDHAVVDMDRYQGIVEDVIKNNPKPLSMQQAEIEDLKLDRAVIKEMSENQTQITQLLQQLSGNFISLTKEVAKLKFKEK